MTEQEIKKYENEKLYLVLFTTMEKPNLAELKRMLRTNGKGKIYSRSGPHSGVFSVFNRLHQFRGASADDCWNINFTEHTTYIFASTVKCNLMLASCKYNITAYEATAKELDQIRMKLNEFYEFVNNTDAALSALTRVHEVHKLFSETSDSDTDTIEKFVTASSIQSVEANFKKYATPHFDAYKQELEQWIKNHRMSV